MPRQSCSVGDRRQVRRKESEHEEMIVASLDDITLSAIAEDSPCK